MGGCDILISMYEHIILDYWARDNYEHISSRFIDMR